MCLKDFMKDKETQLKSLALKTAFLLSIALGLIGCGLMVRYGVFRDKVYQGAEGDTIVPEVSTSYCKEVMVTSGNKNTDFTVYVNPGLPDVSKKRYYYQSGTSFYIASWSFQIWRVYLLKGTTLDMNICADQYLMFYVIKGEKYHTEWAQSTLFDKYMYKFRILPQKDCKNRESYRRQVLEVTENDYFFLMFSSSVGWRFLTRVSAMMIFNRTVYDTSKASYKCKSTYASNPCSVPLRYNSNDTILIHFTPFDQGMPNIFKKDEINWHTVPRDMYYLLFFGGIFGSIFVLTILYSIWRCLVKNITFKQDKFLLLSVPKRVYSDSTGSKLNERSRKTTRATLGSFEVVSNRDYDEYVDEEEKDEEEQNITLNENQNAGIRYLTDEQLQNSCLTATGISAI